MEANRKPLFVEVWLIRLNILVLYMDRKIGYSQKFSVFLTLKFVVQFKLYLDLYLYKSK